MSGGLLVRRFVRGIFDGNQRRVAERALDVGLEPPGRVVRPVVGGLLPHSRLRLLLLLFLLLLFILILILILIVLVLVLLLLLVFFCFIFVVVDKRHWVAKQ